MTMRICYLPWTPSGSKSRFIHHGSCYISQPKDNIPPVTSPNKSAAPTPDVDYDPVTNQPLSQQGNYTQTSDAESDVQLPSNAEEQTTLHTPSHVTDSSSSANVCLVYLKLCLGDTVSYGKRSLQLCDATVFLRYYRLNQKLLSLMSHIIRSAN